MAQKSTFNLEVDVSTSISLLLTELRDIYITKFLNKLILNVKLSLKNLF